VQSRFLFLQARSHFHVTYYLILDSDNEDIDVDSYDTSELEMESDSNSDAVSQPVLRCRRTVVSDSESDSGAGAAVPPVCHAGNTSESDDDVQPVSRQTTAAAAIQPDTSLFSEAACNFKPLHPAGPRNLPDAIDSDSKPSDFFALLWNEHVWNMLVTETNRQAEYVRADKPSSYHAKNFIPMTVHEMKAFFGCRVAIEMLVQKDRYEQYWRMKDSCLISTPGFGKVFTRDRFLAIWSLLHCVNEQDPAVDKHDKIH